MRPVASKHGAQQGISEPTPAKRQSRAKPLIADTSESSASIYWSIGRDWSRPSSPKGEALGPMNTKCSR